MNPDAQSLVDSFNRTAADFRSGNVPPGLLVSKFEALSHYKAADEESKTRLVTAMFEAIVAEVRSVASAQGSLKDYDVVDNIAPLLKKIAEPENVGRVPDHAPQAFAELTIALSERVGKVTTKTLQDNDVHTAYLNAYREHASKLGALLMSYADTFDNNIGQRQSAPPVVKQQKFSQ